MPELGQAEVLLVLGTSLAVMPFASLVDRVSEKTPRLLINREPVGPFAADRLSSRDAVLLGDCDDSCHKLAEMLGWSEDFERIKAEGAKAFDEKK